MANAQNDNLNLLAGKSLDNRAGKISGGRTVPFASVAEANTAINPNQRHIGLECYVMISGVATKHVYRDGIADNNLVANEFYVGGGIIGDGSSNEPFDVLPTYVSDKFSGDGTQQSPLDISFPVLYFSSDHFDGTGTQQDPIRIKASILQGISTTTTTTLAPTTTTTTLAPTTTTTTLAPTTTTTTTIPSFTAYWGWKDTINPFVDQSTMIAAAQGSGSFSQNSPVVADYTTNTQPKYLWMAEPVGQPLKDYWDGDGPLATDDEGSIGGTTGTTGNLFASPQVIGGYRFYITEYQTQNTSHTVEFRQSIT